MQALILAAGLGTRLKPFTDKHPKALAPVNGKTVLQRNIEYLQRAGIKDVIVNVHHFADQIIDLIETNMGWGSNITISNESEEALETGGGIKKAGWFLQQSENCLVMNADILTDLPMEEMIAFHLKEKPLATVATTNRKSSRYLLFEQDNQKLCGWRNTKTNELKGMDGDEKAFSGIQLLNKAIFPIMPFNGKFSMIDVYLELCKTNTILSFDHSSAKMIDIGTMEKLAQAEEMFK